MEYWINLGEDMDLITILFINLASAVVLYTLLSVKISQQSKLNQPAEFIRRAKLIQNDFMRETENYIQIIDTKIQSFRNLIDRSELIAKILNEENQKSEKLIQELKSLTSKESKPVPFVPSPVEDLAIPPQSSVKNPDLGLSFMSINPEKVSGAYTENKYQEEPKREEPPIPQVDSDLVEDVFSGIGKAFKGIMGVETETLDTPMQSAIKQAPKEQKKLDLSIKGDVFDSESETEIQDNTIPKAKTDFEKALFPDKKYTAEDALKEIPASSNKIERVVFLLKKGFTHQETSRAVQLQVKEISLIEAIYMGKVSNK
jgi:hypothetical protein